MKRIYFFLRSYSDTPFIKHYCPALMNKLTNYIEKKIHLAPIYGFVSILFLIFTMIFAACTFDGYCHSYSIFNHFISELGDTDQSPFYWVFSLGLCISGPLNILLIIALANHLDNRLSHMAKSVGIVSGMAGFFVGVFPADILMIPHLVAAIVFFVGTLLAVGLFGVAIFLDNKNKMAKWYAVPSFFTSLTGIIFLGLPNQLVREFLFAKQEFSRPEFWINPFFEWLVFFSLVVWIVLIAHHLYHENKVSIVEV